jgi:hypothetical protein
MRSCGLTFVTPVFPRKCIHLEFFFKHQEKGVDKNEASDFLNSFPNWGTNA